jgi:hypothetical protein
MGGLTKRIQGHLEGIKAIRKGARGGTVAENVTNLLLQTTFSIAKERKWLQSMPVFNGDTFTFNINPGYFAKKEMAKLLAATSKS